LFGHVAAHIASLAGSPWMFLLAAAIVLAWGMLGRLYGYSDTWQLVINTGTTIVTFLMVFLIQNTQNRDAKAIHLKLDEVIRALRHAHNEMIDIEELEDGQLEQLAEQYRRYRTEWDERQAAKKRENDSAR
jgi:low affinity Fe/Cu permease